MTFETNPRFLRELLDQAAVMPWLRDHQTHWQGMGQPLAAAAVPSEPEGEADEEEDAA